jgi:hypothetical protein
MVSSLWHRLGIAFDDVVVFLDDRLDATAPDWRLTGLSPSARRFVRVRAAVCRRACPRLCEAAGRALWRCRGWVQIRSSSSFEPSITA